MVDMTFQDVKIVMDRLWGTVVKCPKLAYGDEDVKRFVIYLKRIIGFKEAVWAREKKIREENEKIEKRRKRLGLVSLQKQLG